MSAPGSKPAALDRAREVGLRVLGRADPVTHGASVQDGVVVAARHTAPVLELLREEGYRVTPSGPKHSIVERTA